MMMMMMMALDQNEEDPKEKIRGKKTEDAKSSPERHRATDVAPFAPRFLARANASRLRVPSPNRFFFLNARDFASHTRHHRARRKRVQKRSYK